MKTIYDRAAFLHAMDNDEEFVQEILETFMEDSGRIVAELTLAIARGDLDGTRHLAHTLQGAAANVYASSLRETALRLETVITNNDPANQKHLLEEIIHSRSEFVAFIQSESCTSIVCAP